MTSRGIAAPEPPCRFGGMPPAVRVNRARWNPLTIAPPIPQPGGPGDYTQAESQVTLLCNKSRKRLIL